MLHHLRFASLARAAVVSATTLLLSATAWAGDGAALFSLLPSDTRAIVGVNVETLRQAPIFQQMVGVVGATPQFSAIQTQMGLNPATDVQTVVIATDRVTQNNSDRALVLVEATFQASAMTTSLASQAGVTREADVGTVAVFTRGNSRIAVLRDGVAVLGTPALVDQVVAVAGGADALSGSLSRRITGTNRRHAVWFATQAPPDQASDMRYISGSLNISDTVAATVVVNAVSDEKATELSTDFNTTQTRLAAEPTVQQFGLASVINSLQGSVSGSDFTITGTIDAGTWAMLSATIVALAASEL